MRYKIYIPQLKCDVAGIGTGIAGAAGAAASVYAADKQFEATRETNEQNKQLAAERNALEYQMFGEANEFNASQAELSREHAFALQKDAQEYNSIGAQIDRARAAGVNPAAVVNGSGTTAVAASPSSAQAQSAAPPNMVAAQMQVPDLSALQGISSAINNIGQSAQAFAQTKKIKEETKGLEIYNKFADRIHDMGLRVSESEIKKNYAAAEQMQSHADNLRQNIEEMKAHIALMQSQGKLFDEQTFAQNIENAFKGKEMELYIDKISTELQIAKLDAKFAIETFAARVYGVKLQNQKTFAEILVDKAQADYFEQSAQLVDTQTNYTAFNYQIDRMYSSRERRQGLAQGAQTIKQMEWENSTGVRAFGMFCDAASALGSLASGGAMAFGARAAAKRFAGPALSPVRPTGNIGF